MWVLWKMFFVNYCYLYISPHQPLFARVIPCRRIMLWCTELQRLCYFETLCRYVSHCGQFLEVKLPFHFLDLILQSQVVFLFNNIWKALFFNQPHFFSRLTLTFHSSFTINPNAWCWAFLFYVFLGFIIPNILWAQQTLILIFVEAKNKYIWRANTCFCSPICPCSLTVRQISTVNLHHCF